MKHPLPRLLLAALVGLAPAVASAQGPPGTPPPLSASPPARASIEAQLARGRELLLRGRTAAAEAVFERAAAVDGDSFPARRWLLRTWMEHGRSNDTLDALDELRREGHDGPVMDCLYGVAFALRAQQHLAQGVTDSSVQMNFQDAVDLLAGLLEAPEADELYGDAWLPLATAAWYTSDLDLSRAAAERAVALMPSNPRASWQLGRTALSQFQVTRPADVVESADWGRVAEGHWRTARAAFARTVELCGEPLADEAGRALLADAAVQLGHTLVWKRLTRDAAAAYGTALSWAPERVDIAQLRSLLAPAKPGAPNEAFNAALAAGVHDFEHRFEDDPRDATLLWWLGYSYYSLGENGRSEKSFLAALAKAPGYVNAWHYIALARYAAGDFGGAGDALLTGWRLEPPTMLAEVLNDRDRFVPQIEYLASQAMRNGRLEDAAALNEICAEAVQNEPRYWNNMAMLLRDEADRRRHEGAERGDEQVSALYERSYAAYRRALRLVPDDPQLLNDTALMLHYYLGRDLEEALAMYQRAIVIAEARLREEGLSPADRARFQTTLDDASGNLPRLEELLQLLKSEQVGRASES